MPGEGHPLVAPTLHLDANWESTPSAEHDGVLRLTVGGNQDADDWQMYQGYLTVVGFFVWLDLDAEVEADMVQRYYLNSGFSILYGLVRRFAVQLSATSPHPRLMLPSFDFSPLVERIFEARTEERGGEAEAA